MNKINHAQADSTGNACTSACTASSGGYAPVLHSALSLDALLPAAFSPVLLSQESLTACRMNKISHAQADGTGSTCTPACKASSERVFVSLDGSSCSEVHDAMRGLCEDLVKRTLVPQIKTKLGQRVARWSWQRLLD